jgi:hypothetical protein
MASPNGPQSVGGLPSSMWSNSSDLLHLKIRFRVSTMADVRRMVSTAGRCAVSPTGGGREDTAIELGELS